MKTYDPHEQRVIPTNNNLVIRRDPPVQQFTKSGLALSATPEKQHQGLVLAAGPGWIAQNGQLVPTRIVPGEVVLWSKMIEGSPVVVDGEELVVISEDAVMAVINPNASTQPGAKELS